MGEVSFAYAARAQEEQVLMSIQVPPERQFPNQGLGNPRVEGEVEGREGFLRFQFAAHQPSTQLLVLPPLDLILKQDVQKIRESPFLRQRLVESGSDAIQHPGELQPYQFGF